MGAICGALGTSKGLCDESTISTMLSQMNHRGLRRTVFSTNGDLSIGLGEIESNSFTDGSVAAVRGFARENGFVAALEGGITNARDWTAPGQADAQVVCAGYHASGVALPSSLDGPVSLAVWDSTKQQLLLSRDKLGEKSLYYHVAPDNKSLVFGTEIKSILAHPTVQAELDHESLSLHLIFGYVPGPRTLFRNIFKLLPGERLLFKPNSAPQTEKYWRLPAVTDGMEDEAYCIRQLRQLFLKGLERYVNGCQDVAVFLSGGIDSSILVAALRELGVPRISTFTIGFTVDPSRPQTDDLHYARLVAAKYDTAHHEVVVDAAHEPQDRLVRIIKQFDDLVMTPNSYSKCLLAEAVRDTGVTSVLTGSAAAGACGIHRQFLNRKWRKKWLERTQECTSDEERYYVLRGRVFDLESQEDLLRNGAQIERQDVVDALNHYVGDVQAPDFFRRFLFSNLMITSTEKSVRILDKVCSMASVECRSPYMDRELVEFSTQLPTSFDGEKTFVSLKTHMEKAFQKELPKEVVERKVIGYPSYYWQRGELEALQDRLFSRTALEANGIFNPDGVARIREEEKHSTAKSVGKHSWALIQFCLWYEIHVKKNPAFL